MFDPRFKQKPLHGCSGCRQDFTSVALFDRHRVGVYSYTYSQGEIHTWKRRPPVRASVPTGGKYQHLPATGPRHYSNGWTDRPFVTTLEVRHSLGGWLRRWRVALVRNRAEVRPDFSHVTGLHAEPAAQPFS
jgi:hypothetical protein